MRVALCNFTPWSSSCRLPDNVAGKSIAIPVSETTTFGQLQQRLSTSLPRDYSIYAVCLGEQLCQFDYFQDSRIEEFYPCSSQMNNFNLSIFVKMSKTEPLPQESFSIVSGNKMSKSTVIYAPGAHTINLPNSSSDENKDKKEDVLLKRPNVFFVSSYFLIFL